MLVSVVRRKPAARIVSAVGVAMHSAATYLIATGLIAASSIVAYSVAMTVSVSAAGTRPNVVLIMSDDQGGGDYGFLGNPVIRTPNLDALAGKSGLLSQFYVSPVCAPTRASLMTGRYNYRTRCIDTYLGRAMMDPDEVTVAEMLSDAGYRTGIYGKWHLGDCYPMRPMDQGFDDSLVHRGGGIGQPSDPIGAEGKYTDPTLFKNGVETPMQGYCTDIYFDAALSFIDASIEQQEPFFTYIATNAPHGPFDDVPESLYREYREVDFTGILTQSLSPKRLAAETDKLARIAAMITNIDTNVGRLMRHLDDCGIGQNTIVMYLNDNGPNTMRYVGDMRGMKTHVDDGGIRSPLIFHWPDRVAGKSTSDRWTAHIDVVPTILDACGVKPPGDVQMDGRSFLPLLTGAKTDWPTRTLVFQSHRGNVPVKYHHFALHEDPWKLVHASGFGKESLGDSPQLELYHLRDDPAQRRDLSGEQPEVVERLKRQYDAWFADVGSTRPDNYAPPRIVIGTDAEPETVLTRQDWRHTSGKPWGRGSRGFWLLESRGAATFDAEVIFKHDHPAGTVRIDAAGETHRVDVPSNVRRVTIPSVRLPDGPIKFEASARWAEPKGIEEVGPHQVILSVR